MLRTHTALAGLLVALALPGVASAHPYKPGMKLAHPNADSLRHLAIIASDMVEAGGARYVGAVGTCRSEDPRRDRQGGIGYLHTRCYMQTSLGYRFVVTFHVLPGAKLTQTVIRTQ